MVITRRNNKQPDTKDAAVEKLDKRESATVAEIDLETPKQSLDDVENKKTESTLMPNTEEQETKK